VACTPTPALDSDFPDPSLLVDPSAGGVAYAYGTNITAPGSQTLLNIPVIHSSDPHLGQWSSAVDALPRLPAWARPGFTWAPAVVHRAGGPYRLYFTARYGFSGRPCIGVAVSDIAAGPFKPTSETKPLVCPLGQGGAIDPSVFEDDDGAEYLLWKTDSNCCEGVPTILTQRLSADGLSFAGADLSDLPWLTPDAVPLILRDQPWEGRVVEAPTLTKHAGQYFLFYSGGDYASSRYAVGYASAKTLLGPYEKAPTPILSEASTGLSGPGGQDVFEGPDGETWIAFHGWRDGRPNRFRALYFGRVAWDSGGPHILVACTPPPPPAPPSSLSLPLPLPLPVRESR
jgi:beta-xylosidase